MPKEYWGSQIQMCGKCMVSGNTEELAAKIGSLAAGKQADLILKSLN